MRLTASRRSSSGEVPVRAGRGRHRRAPQDALHAVRIEDWGKLLGDTAAVAALLDRMLHHGQVLKCGPRSWRARVEADLHVEARRGNQASRLGHSVWPVLRCPPLAGFVTSPEDRGEDDEPCGRRTRVHRGDVHGARCIRPFTVTTIVTAAGCAIPPLRWGGSTRCCADTSSRFSVVMPRRHPRSRNAPDVRRPGAPVRCADSHVAGALLIIGIV